MIKLILKHLIADQCINVLFNGLEKNLITSGKWIKGKDINESHIGKKIFGINFGKRPEKMPETAYKRCHGATIFYRQGIRMIDTQVNNPPTPDFRYLYVYPNRWYLVE